MVEEAGHGSWVVGDDSRWGPSRGERDGDPYARRQLCVSINDLRVEEAGALPHEHVGGEQRVAADVDPPAARRRGAARGGWSAAARGSRTAEAVEARTRGPPLHATRDGLVTQRCGGARREEEVTMDAVRRFFDVLVTKRRRWARCATCVCSVVVTKKDAPNDGRRATGPRTRAARRARRTRAAASR